MRKSEKNSVYIQSFRDRGFFIYRNLFSPEEVESLRREAERDQKVNSAEVRDDAGGFQSRIAIWDSAGEDLFGKISRSSRIVSLMQECLGEEVYLYHSKLMLKEPNAGGAWEWHQDYGYWYKSCLYPNMASCMLAIDKATKENGCLQVLEGSHHLGRIDHQAVAGQTGADPERVELALDKHSRIYVELNPGDAVFFHGNLLHASDQNHSDYPRWAYISCFNTASNSPVLETRHASYAPLQLVEEEELVESFTAVGA